MSIVKAKIYLQGIISGIESLEQEGDYITNQQIANQFKKVLKELKDYKQ